MLHLAASKLRQNPPGPSEISKIEKILVDPPEILKTKNILVDPTGGNEKAHRFQWAISYSNFCEPM